MLGEELTGGDYFSQPLEAIYSHPDFSLEAYTFIAEIGAMTTAQLETLKTYRERATNAG